MKSIEIKTLIDFIEKQRDVYSAVMRLAEKTDGYSQSQTYNQLVGRMQGTLDVISMLKEIMGEDA